MLTVTLSIGMVVSASAAVTNTSNTGGATSVITTGIRGINESGPIGDLANFKVTVNDGKSGTLSLDDLSDLEVTPGDVIKIPLYSNLFLNASGIAFGQGNVSLSALNNGGISVRSSFSKGAGAYTASLGGNKNGSYIMIEFNDDIYLTAQRFTSSIYLARNGSRKSSTKITITGVLQTPTQELSWGDDYADLSDGSAVYARTAVRNAELYLGDYCTVTRSLLKGVKYAGTATANDIDDKDALVINRHPAIQYVYKLKTVGLKAAGNIVTFDLDYRYYVYDTNGIYIGTSDKPLPYWTKYYLSTKKYDVIKVK